MNKIKKFSFIKGSKNKILVNTIPHSGTHLISSILDTIGYKQATYKKFGFIEKKIGLNWRLSEKFTNILPEKDNKSIYVSVASPKLVRFKILKNYLNKVSNGEYILSHIPYNKIFYEYLIEKKWKGLFIIRDPRDMCISMLKHIESRPYHFMHHHLFKKLKTSICPHTLVKRTYSSYLDYNKIKLLLSIYYTK